MKTRLTYLFACLALLSGTVASAQNSALDGSYQPSTERYDKRSVGWLLGDQLYAAAGLNCIGEEPQLAEEIFQRAQSLAAKVGVRLPALPPAGCGIESTLRYLGTVGSELETVLEEKLGTETAAAFELATVPTLMLLRLEDIQRDSQLRANFGVYVRLQGVISGMPQNVWSGMAEVLENNGSLDEMSAAIKQFKTDSVAFLSGNQYSGR